MTLFVAPPPVFSQQYCFFNRNRLKKLVCLSSSKISLFSCRLSTSWVIPIYTWDTFLGTPCRNGAKRWKIENGKFQDICNRTLLKNNVNFRSLAFFRYGNNFFVTTELPKLYRKGQKGVCFIWSRLLVSAYSPRVIHLNEVWFNSTNFYRDFLRDKDFKRFQ